MANRDFARKLRRTVVIAVAVALSAGLQAARPAAAAGVDQPDTSLKLVPEDAAFYSTMLRNREQIEAVADSRAWGKLKELPFVKMGLALYNLQAASPQSGPGKFKAAMADPQQRKTIDLLLEMVSDEVFFFGDESFADFMKLMQAVNFASSYGPLMAQLGNQAKDIDQNKIQAMMIIGALAENQDLIAVPNMIIGFKLKNAKQATEELGKLEEQLTKLLEAREETKGRFQKTKVAGHEYLTLSLDGKMIPWDKLPIDDIEELDLDEGDVAKVIDRIKGQTLVIALGVRDNYVLLSVGRSTDSLARLGTGKPLAGRPEFKPLAKFADKRITSISYLSEAMNRELGNNSGQIDQLAEVVEELLPLAKLESKQEQRIRKDAAALAEDLKGLLPEPGAAMSFSFLTDEGIEAYQYNWSRNVGLDGSKPLGLLGHLGGSPMLAVVARGEYAPEQYDLLVKWLKIGYRYFEEFGLPKMEKHERERAEKFVKLVQPLLERADNANRKMLIPALADSQVAMVVDAKLTSKRFHKSMPATEEPMPMVEPALVLGVSDAELLRKACVEYQAIADGLLDVIRRMEPDSIPEDYGIPRPKVTGGKAGTICVYSVPKKWGLDRKIAPSFGLSDNVAVVAISRQHVQRLLKTAPLTAGGVLAKAKRPRAVAAVFDWPALLEAARPWVDLALERINEQSEDDNKAVVDQVHTVMDVLGVVRKITSESYFQGDALVNHTLVEIRDIEE